MKNKIENAEIPSAHKDNGFIVICPYCKEKQPVPQQPDGMTKAFKWDCLFCLKTYKVDLPKLLKGIHFVASVKFTT